MAALQKPDYAELYEDTLLSLNDIEDFMGELAEMLTHVADALTGNPDEVDLSPGAAPNMQGLSVMDHDWPTFARLQSLQNEWRAARDRLIGLWATLSERERATVTPLPPFGAGDSSRPLV